MKMKFTFLNEGFNPQMIQAVWEKGTIVSEDEKNYRRKDACGAWMQRDKYGDRNDPLGWEIDHIFPKGKGGSDLLSNLQPLHWENNCSKGQNYPNYTCAVTAKK